MGLFFEVHTVLGEGNKLLLDIPVEVKNALSPSAGDVITLDELIELNRIVKSRTPTPTNHSYVTLNAGNNEYFSEDVS